MEPFENLEVNSVVDLQVPVIDVAVLIGAEMVGEKPALRSVARSGMGLL